jgi:hypothetical protein
VCSKHSNFKSGKSLFFKKKFNTKCAPLLIKIEHDLTLVIRRAKRFELMKNVFIIDLKTFGLNMFLTLKIVDFENVALTKVVHIYVVEGVNA